jgi:hypothetical protein
MSVMLRPLLCDRIERDTKRTDSATLPITHERLAQGLERCAVLQGDARHYGRIRRHDAGHAVDAVIAQEDFTDLAAGRMSAYRSAKFQPEGLKVEGFCRSSIWKTFPFRAHDRPLRVAITTRITTPVPHVQSKR